MDAKFNYIGVFDVLKEKITSGVFPADSLLPTELMLAQQYSVSRPTIAKVYNRLQDEGYVVKRKGLGTVVVYKNTNINTFGLLLPGAGESEIFSIINDQLLEQSRNGKFHCMWEGATASNAEIRKTHIISCCNSYIERKVDGIFFSPLERVADADQINRIICEKIHNARIPLVLIDRDIVEFPARSEYDLAGLDNYRAGYEMGQHLIDAGCEIIYFFYRPNSAYSVKLRIAGLRSAIQEKNLHFSNENIFCGNPDDFDFVKQMKIQSQKTGILCANDSTAAVLMSSLEEIGVKITSDVLICGFDNMKYGEHLKYSLTSYIQPCKEIADISLELMFRRVLNRRANPIMALMPGTIISRESSHFGR